MTLELIDDEAEPIAQCSHRFREIARDLDRDLARDLVLGRGHSVPVSKNQVVPMPPAVIPRA